MKRLVDWQVTLGIVLILMTALFYYFHFLIFRDIHHILIYFIGDIAFVFFEVLLVTLVIHRLLHIREKNSIKRKINMLIGAFFSEVGTELLRRLVIFEGDRSRISNKLAIPDNWSERTFLNIREDFMQSEIDINIGKGNLECVKECLNNKKFFLLNLLLNSSIHDDELFTNLVWSVFHLLEELDRRENVNNLSHTDRTHLEEDIRRVYKLLLSFWMDFIKHIHAKYPFLHSLAVRTNPFDEESTVEV